MTKRKKNTINAALLFGLVLIIFLFSRFLPSSSMVFVVIKKGAIYALVAASMNLTNGFTGLFSLGQAGFMLIGAYIFGIFTIPAADRLSVYQYFDGGIISFTLPVLLAVILGGIAAAIFAWLIGLPVLRLKSDYLAIATLGFAEIIRAVFQWDKIGPITNASNVLRKFPNFDSLIFDLRDPAKGGTWFGIDLSGFFNKLFGAQPWLMTFFSVMIPVLIAGVSIAVIVMLINSSFGRAFKAIRDDEVAAEAMGINLARHKMLSFCTSAFFAGISGALLAMFQTTINAAPFKSAMTYEILLIVVLGGIGSITGSCIGAFLFVASSEWWLRGLDSGTFMGITAPTIFRNGFRLVVFSIIIMAVVLFWRKGIMGDKEFDIEAISNKVKMKIKAIVAWITSRRKKGEVNGND